MTREEAREAAAKSYASKMCDLCLDEYCKEMRLVCPQFKEYTIAFTEGIKWADEHPKNMWHDVSEEPRCEELLLGEDSDGFSIYRWCGQEDNWEAFVNATGLSRWAYIADLLPKGGEK